MKQSLSLENVATMSLGDTIAVLKSWHALVSWARSRISLQLEVKCAAVISGFCKSANVFIGGVPGRIFFSTRKPWDLLDSVECLTTFESRYVFMTICHNFWLYLLAERWAIGFISVPLVAKWTAKCLTPPDMAYWSWPNISLFCQIISSKRAFTSVGKFEPNLHKLKR